VVAVPEYNLVPRGWYESEKHRKRLPDFSNLEIHAADRCFKMSRRQVEKFRGGKVKLPLELDTCSKTSPQDVKVELVP